jgi:phospho-N-acetylmuramoyl-pentapeptide-transferase
LNVIQYVTFRTAWATITALLISLLLGGKSYQKARRPGNSDRKYAKKVRHRTRRNAERRTMGGILIIGSVIVSTLLWARIDSLYLWIGPRRDDAFAAVGFADDWIKIVKKEISD